jgi:hypothetical protein
MGDGHLRRRTRGGRRKEQIASVVLFGEPVGESGTAGPMIPSSATPSLRPSSSSLWQKTLDTQVIRSPMFSKTEMPGMPSLGCPASLAVLKTGAQNRIPLRLRPPYSELVKSPHCKWLL